VERTRVAEYIATRLWVSPQTAVPPHEPLRRLPGWLAALPHLIGREDLEGIHTDEALGHEPRRRQLIEDLEDVRRNLRARQVKLPCRLLNDGRCAGEGRDLDLLSYPST